MTMPEDVEDADGAGSSNEYSASRHSKFRFKSKRSRSDHGDEHDARRKRRKHDRHERDEEEHLASHRHRHHHRSKRRKRSPEPLKDDPSLYDDTYLPNSRSSQYLDPTTAFRESLFDALADDEGAAYWEGVYGQPIHTYPNTKISPAGELEQMDDEEYAAYVRARMYERTHQHVVEERGRREEARKSQRRWREETERMERERGEFERRVEESLRRGEERKARKRWREAWERYERGWEELKGRLGQVDKDDGGEMDKPVRDRIPWPVETGRWKHVSKEEVENFWRSAPPDEMDLHALLKTERVRWHPDKTQQRFGGRGVDVDTMKSITAVFQVIDRMWTDIRDKKGAV